MPIRPENRYRYGADWAEFSRSIRFERAGGRCECEGECGRGTHVGRCPNRHGQPAYGTGSNVVLTVAHLCHVPECREHVRAMCQGCHLHYDRDHHAETRSATRRAAAIAAGQNELAVEDNAPGQMAREVDDLARFIPVAMRSQARNTDKWKYFCGCCWREIGERQELARRLIEDGKV